METKPFTNPNIDDRIEAHLRRHGLIDDPETAGENRKLRRVLTTGLLMLCGIVVVPLTPINFSSFGDAFGYVSLGMVFFWAINWGLFGEFSLIKKLEENRNGEVRAFILGLFIFLGLILSRS